MKGRMTSLLISDELADAILDLRTTEEFKRCSISEIIRCLLARGLKASGIDFDKPHDPAKG